MPMGCAICLDSFKTDESDGKAPRILACHHVFHSDCFGNWVKTSKTCPTCRRPANHGCLVYAHFVEEKVKFNANEELQKIKNSIEHKIEEVRNQQKDSQNRSGLEQKFFDCFQQIIKMYSKIFNTPGNGALLQTFNAIITPEVAPQISVDFHQQVLPPSDPPAGSSLLPSRSLRVRSCDVSGSSSSHPAPRRNPRRSCRNN